jgi:hypothetical protein
MSLEKDAPCTRNPALNLILSILSFRRYRTDHVQRTYLLRRNMPLDQESEAFLWSLPISLVNEPSLITDKCPPREHRAPQARRIIRAPSLLPTTTRKKARG